MPSPHELPPCGGLIVVEDEIQTASSIADVLAYAENTMNEVRGAYIAEASNDCGDIVTPTSVEAGSDHMLVRYNPNFGIKNDKYPAQRMEIIFPDKDELVINMRKSAGFVVVAANRTMDTGLANFGEQPGQRIVTLKRLAPAFFLTRSIFRWGEDMKRDTLLHEPESTLISDAVQAITRAKTANYIPQRPHMAA